MEKRPFNILITAGGTSEKIDSVRRISNSGTGTLGALVAEAFAANVPDCNIVYICSEGAVRPDASLLSSAELEIIVADDVPSVDKAIRNACAKTSFDAIIHSMAISDYCVRAVSDTALMSGDILERLAKVPCEHVSPEDVIQEALFSPPGFGCDRSSSKISSDKDNLIIVLEKAPKLIASLRGLAKDAVIVGFKLLSEVSEDELVRVGHSLLLKNDCDFVLANDSKTVMSGNHEGLLIGRDGTYVSASSKESIAKLIVKSVIATSGATTSDTKQ